MLSAAAHFPTAATIEAADGAKALAILGAIQRDLILLDMRMPIMDGWAFAAAYQRQPGPQAPILVLTATTDAAADAAAIQANGYLCKPFSLNQLFSSVAQYAS